MPHPDQARNGPDKAVAEEEGTFGRDTAAGAGWKLTGPEQIR